jgi:mRNA-degrading endonuclease RelE of RelBE toxin-antitoxin system
MVIRVLRFAATYLLELRELPVFDRAKIQAAVGHSLTTDADNPSRNRRPLKAQISWCPEAKWQLRVGNYRVLYSVDPTGVEILRVRFKGRRSTEEMGSS